MAYVPGSDNGIKAIDQSPICLNPEHQWKEDFEGNIDVHDLRYTLVHEIRRAICFDHPGPSGQEQKV